MSAENLSPWVKEQLMKLQQSQQDLQSIMAQRQHLAMEQAETAKALEELQKIGDSTVYKFAGTVLIKSTKQVLAAELEEKSEMAKTKSTVLEKQETRIKETLKQQESKIAEMMKGKPDVDNPRR